MTKETVLALLKEKAGGYCSGEEMSRALGLSRAAVWKAVEGLRQEGYEISSAPHRGYRLERSLDQIRSGELSGALRGCTVGSNLVCLDSVDSTNTYAKQLAVQGAPHGTVVLAETQTGGRGRTGKRFASPAGKGLYLSALLRPQLPPARVVELTAWTAVALCGAVEEVCGARPGIKWTNDLILQNRKLCGILTEMSMEAESDAVQYVVVGAGFNVSQSAEDFGPELAGVAVSLEQALGRPVRRTDLAAAVIRGLDRLAADFPGKKAEYLERYRRDCLTTGRQIRLIRHGESRTAFAEEIDDSFALVVRWPDGSREAVAAGDVSVRGLLGYV